MVYSILLGIVVSGWTPASQDLARQWAEFRLPATGNNGYEDYIAAAIRVDSDRHRAFEVWDIHCRNVRHYREIGIEGPKGAPPPNPTGLSPNATTLERCRAYAREFGGVAELLKAGNLKPVHDPRSEYDATTLFPEYAHFKSVGRSLGKIAYVQLADGNSAAATTTLLEGLKFARNVSRVGPLISNLVGVAIQSIVLAEFEKYLDKFSAKDVLKILTTVSQMLEEPEPLLATMAAERKHFSENHRVWNASLKDILPEGDPLYEKLMAMDDATRREVLSLAQAKVSYYIRSIEDTLKSGESNWLNFKDDWMTGMQTDRNRLESVAEVADAFAVVATPVFANVFKVAARTKTQLRLLRLHAYVLRYRWDFDRLPNKLEHAVPSDSILDPFSKKEFVYEPLGHHGYRLYSQGFQDVGPIELRYRPISSTGSEEDGPRPPLSMNRP